MTHTPIRGLLGSSSLLGAYAEASPDVHCLREHTATHEARLRWEEMGARRYHRRHGRAPYPRCMLAEKLGVG